MLQFYNMVINFIAGVWTTVFGGVVLDFGSVTVTYGELIGAFIICIIVVNLFWRGAKY